MPKEAKVLIDLGYKFNNSKAIAIYKETIDVFEDGTNIICRVVPLRIVEKNCDWVESVVEQNMGIEEKQIIDYLD